MRHQLSGRQLSRNSAHRHALLRNMATSLLRHEVIRTTLPKAKELRRVVEPLITLAKNDSQAARRRAFDALRDEAVVEKLFAELGPRYQTRPGGYTSILRMFPRPGDSAPMALMQLMDRPEVSEAPAAGEGEDKKAKKGKATKAAAAEGAEEARPKKAKAKKAAADEGADAEAKPAKKKAGAKKKAAAKKAGGKKK